MSEKQNNPDPRALTELLNRFSREFETGTIKSVAEFLKLIDNELSIEDIAALVDVEIEMRRSMDESAFVQDYFDTFPGLSQYVAQRAMTLEALHETTAAKTEIVDVAAGSIEKRQLIGVGDKLDDFELVAELGKGSFATVFLARQISMQRMVALKVSEDHGMEAQTLAQLDHRNIVRVYDQRRENSYNLHLLYMQYLEGGTLLDVLRAVLNLPEDQLNGKQFVKCVDEAIIERGGSPNYESVTRNQFLSSDWEQTICRIGYHLARALEYAHEKGVLHRDIKPANVLIGRDCNVMLADFNISSATSVVGESKFGGSLAYMSPEQIRAFNRDDEFDSEQLDESCDLYSLGVMLYHLLMRELPFYALTKSRSSDGLGTMVAERENSIERLVAALQSKSPLMRSALIRCLQPEIKDRPLSACDLANQLKLGLDRDAEKFLFPSSRNWTLVFQKQFYLVCVVVCLLFNTLAAAFVYNFNLDESVPETASTTFTYIMYLVNGIVFPIGIFAFVYLTRAVPQALRLCTEGKHQEVPDMGLATGHTLSAGHIQAVICGALWLIAGVIYPVALWCFGTDLDLSNGIDFIASHWLAGISITTLTFFAMVYLSLKIWLPVLIQNCYSKQVISTVNGCLDSLIKKIPIYQFLAVCVPLLAVALLVVFSDLVSRSRFPLQIISVFGLLTIPIVLFGGNRIQAICERLLLVFRNDESH